MPASTLNEWQVYYRLKNRKQPDSPPAVSVSSPSDTVQAQCDAIMKLLG
ncbi:conserved hypothetical protein [Xenorhabdus szentirmaii DSM 16338]|uniref:Uncharacterized protein n=1 Tax=Xenorhabdus szentirmaii DSM 16338 TaxID=1427518 RepID=W1J117_9GAMM|nr:conserved hypothetical protein [Xenorhabdus szentirmaii DSM 16338]